MCIMNFLTFLFFSFLFFFFFLIFLIKDFKIFLEWEIMSINSSMVVMTFLFDWMSFLFMSFVLLISALVVFYSNSYMLNDKFINRFILLIVLFVLSMMMLIVSPNLISILLGWDGLGLVSYCLVIYFNNFKSYNAGMLTVLSNRIGDVMLLMVITWMMNYGSWNYIFYLEYMLSDMVMNIIGILVVLASMTKSAQIPFSSWLPAAMAAPTPVSALVHSSTLVTAGIYLMIRFNILLEDSFIGKMLLLLSGLTMFMSGLGANFEFDFKKIIALSTLSQLGLMMMILSLGFYKLAFFHLLIHAMFKALLFLCAGSVIHNMGDSQDLRLMGGLSYYMPVTISCMNIANLALCGMPFLAGFYSKDLILEFSSMNVLNIFIYLLFYISTGLTVCYTFRMLFYSLVGGINCGSLNILHYESWIMVKSMLGLMFMSIVSGSMINWLMFFSPYMICLPFYMKYMTLLVCLFGAIFGYYLSNVSLFFVNKSLVFYKLSHFLGSMWFLPFISSYGLIYYPLMLGDLMVKNVDYGWSEYFGSQNLYNKLMLNSQYSYLMQINNLKIYFLLMILWVLILLLMFMFI
nr:NADH dehydrogenase subunit 5 [Stipomorpha sp.]